MVEFMQAVAQGKADEESGERIGDEEKVEETGDRESSENKWNNAREELAIRLKEAFGDLPENLDKDDLDRLVKVREAVREKYADRNIEKNEEEKIVAIAYNLSKLIDKHPEAKRFAGIQVAFAPAVGGAIGSDILMSTMATATASATIATAWTFQAIISHLIDQSLDGLIYLAGKIGKEDLKSALTALKIVNAYWNGSDLSEKERALEKKKEQDGSNKYKQQNRKLADSGAPDIDPDDFEPDDNKEEQKDEKSKEDSFDPSKDGNYDKIKRDESYGKLYRDAKDSKTWYSKERSGDRAHGGEHWKKFVQKKGGRVAS